MPDSLHISARAPVRITAPDPHCVAWMPAVARLMVKPNQRASALYVCRIRWDGHEIICDRDLNIEVTRSGLDPELRFYVGGMAIGGAVVRFGTSVAADDFARLKC